MITEFIFNGEKYKYCYFKDLQYTDLPECKTYPQSQYLDIGCGFDIETTKIPQDPKYSTMWVCAFSLNDLTVVFRTWGELRDFLVQISEFYKLNNKKRLLVYIHNMPFEWQFIKLQLEWNFDKKHGCYEVFGTDDRTIIKACTNGFIEFRDSLILTQMKLEKLPENYELETHKLSGGINYNVTRTSYTPVHICELAYMINDVQVLSEFYHKYIKKVFLEKHNKIPLTATGIVRDELRRNYKNMPKAKRKAIDKQIKKSFPDEEQYNILIRWVFRGGYVHANINLADELYKCNDIRGMDIKSSYPASALQNKFPFYFREFTPDWFDKFGTNKRILKNYGYYGLFEFNNIRAKYHHSIESENKLCDYDKTTAVFDNGRLLFCNKIYVWLTEQDILNYIDFYEWDTITCHTIYVAKKELLPSYLRENFLKFFYLKETIDKTKEPGNYSRSKANLNSNYGMCVSGLLHSNHVFNTGNGKMEVGEKQRDYEDIIRSEILLPAFGIWISAFSRRRLLSMVAKFPEDVFYCDTDSIYLRNYSANKRFFDYENARTERHNLSMDTLTYDNVIYKDLGKFCDDTGKIFKFKTLGAKRYIYTSFKGSILKDKVTIAGCKKGSLEKYSKKINKNIYDIFTHKMELDTDVSEKLTTAYKDEPFTFKVKDYYGDEYIISEKSSVSLYAIPFNMKLVPKYIELIAKMKQYNEKSIGRRV